MSTYVDHNYETTGETTFTITCHYPAASNYALKTSDKREAGYRFGNLTSPVAEEQQYAVKFSKVRDIYANADIDRSMYAPTRRGVSILLSNREVWTVTNQMSETDSVTYDVPFTCNLTFKVADLPQITEADIIEGINRCVSGLYFGGASQVQKLARGALDLIHNVPASE